jgi:hypothetical protein
MGAPTKRGAALLLVALASGTGCTGHGEDAKHAEQTRDTLSFACGKTRCEAGQFCCPWGSVPCISERGTCENDATLDKNKSPPEIDDYAPFSNTGAGYACNPHTGEPCALGHRCITGKMGAGPMTMTSNCQD